MLSDANPFQGGTCENRRFGLLDGCREDEALRELVGQWPGLAPSVRNAIMELARGGWVSGRGLEADGIDPAS